MQSSSKCTISLAGGALGGGVLHTYRPSPPSRAPRPVLWNSSFTVKNPCESPALFISFYSFIFFQWALMLCPSLAQWWISFQFIHIVLYSTWSRPTNWLQICMSFQDVCLRRINILSEYKFQIHQGSLYSIDCVNRLVWKESDYFTSLSLRMNRSWAVARMTSCALIQPFCLTVMYAKKIRTQRMDF